MNISHALLVDWIRARYGRSRPYRRRSRQLPPRWPTLAPNSSSPWTRPSSRRLLCSAPTKSANGRPTGIRSSSTRCPAHDQPGMVFRVDHGHHSSMWVNTAFDLAAGHIQYAYVLNDAMTTLIDIHLTREGTRKDRRDRGLRAHGSGAGSQRTRAALRQRRRGSREGVVGGDQWILCETAGRRAEIKLFAGYERLP